MSKNKFGRYTQRDLNALERNADGYIICEFRGVLDFDTRASFKLDKVIFKDEITINGGHYGNHALICNCIFLNKCWFLAYYYNPECALQELLDEIVIGDNNVFSDECQFTNIDSFGNNNTFGNSCIFDGDCYEDDNSEIIFGNNNIFGKHCRFEKGVKKFNKGCEFGDGCYFHSDITFSKCTFGDKTFFDKDSEFVLCSFGENCYFWKDCKFNTCTFGTYVMCDGCVID